MVDFNSNPDAFLDWVAAQFDVETAWTVDEATQALNNQQFLLNEIATVVGPWGMDQIFNHFNYVHPMFNTYSPNFTNELKRDEHVYRIISQQIDSPRLSQLYLRSGGRDFTQVEQDWECRMRSENSAANQLSRFFAGVGAGPLVDGALPASRVGFVNGVTYPLVRTWSVGAGAQVDIVGSDHTAYHVYKIVFADDEIKYYIDDVLVNTLTGLTTLLTNAVYTPYFDVVASTTGGAVARLVLDMFKWSNKGSELSAI